MNLDKRLLPYLKPQRLRYLIAIAAGVGATAATVGQAWILAIVIGRIFLHKADMDSLLPELLQLALLSLMRAGLDWLSQYLSATAASNIKLHIRNALLEKIGNAGPLFTNRLGGGKLTTTCNEGLDRLEVWFAQYFPQVIFAALIPLLILVVVWPLDLLSGLVLLLTAPIIPIFMWLIGQQTRQRTDRQWQTLSRMSARFLDVIQGLPTLKLFGRSHSEAGRIRQISNTYRQLTMDVLKVAFLSALVLELAATISTAVIAVEVGLRLLYSRLTFEPALFILILAPEFYMPMRKLGAKFHSGMEGLAAAVHVFEILNEPTPIPVLPVKKTGIEIGPIVFDAVNAVYPNSSPPALENVSFQIEPSQITALTGPSGAGKSTVVNLLLRFMDPSAGRITVAGTDLLALDTAHWRQQVSWLPQRPYLFHQTVAQNLRLAKPDATEMDLMEACNKARLLDFIETLPLGFETEVGERGTRLSGGQAQRLAMARAFLKDAPLLFLDEPTANLDPQLDAELQQVLRQLQAGRTVLLIAHRRHTLQAADRVIHLKNMRVEI